jgi:hypothetical protein
VLHLLAPQAANLSSMGSMTGLGTWYPMDDITVDTPYCLHIPLGRLGAKKRCYDLCGDVGMCFLQQPNADKIC